MYASSTDTIVAEKLYTRKELVIMESSIVEFNQDFYIPEIQKLAFHLPYVRILGMHHCGNKRQEKFMRCFDFQDMLWCRDYAEHLVAIFSYQIQSEYYGDNILVWIEGIELEHFSTTDQ